MALEFVRSISSDSFRLGIYIETGSIGNAANNALFVRLTRYGLLTRRDIIPVRVGLRFAVRTVVVVCSFC